MYEVRQTEEFSRWFAGLRDATAKARVLTRIRRLSLGNPGDVKPVGAGISELRIDYGPGYRIYFIRSGSEVVVLVCGGDKSMQGEDIRRAKILAQELRE